MYQSVIRAVSTYALALATCQASALNIKPGHFLFEAGAYNATQGKAQDINIEGTLGDRFNVTDRHDSNALFGLGYLLDGFQHDKYSINYGINAFYLAKTQVSGTIDQELMFTNLSYNYKVRHLPVYATAKALINNKSNQFALTLDAGIGPNFMETSNYRDQSISSEIITLPDFAFNGRSKVTLSAMAGVGLRLTPRTGYAPIECGYRFFYLGEGNFHARTNQILNTLKTGNSYAQALVCSVTA